MVFVLAVEQWTGRILEGAWEFAQPVYMCFVDLEKAFKRTWTPSGLPFVTDSVHNFDGQNF